MNLIVPGLSITAAALKIPDKPGNCLREVHFSWGKVHRHLSHVFLLLKDLVFAARTEKSFPSSSHPRCFVSFRCHKVSTYEQNKGNHRTIIYNASTSLSAGFGTSKERTSKIYKLFVAHIPIKARRCPPINNRSAWLRRELLGSLHAIQLLHESPTSSSYGG